MKPLPLPPEEYSSEYFSRMRDDLMLDDEMKLRTDKDNFIQRGSICLRSPDGTWFKITVANDGTLSASELLSAQLDSEYRPRQTTNPYVTS